MGFRYVTKSDYVERILRREFKSAYDSRWLPNTPANKRSHRLMRMTSLELFPLAYPQYEMDAILKQSRARKR